MKPYCAPITERNTRLKLRETNVGRDHSASGQSNSSGTAKPNRGSQTNENWSSPRFDSSLAFLLLRTHARCRMAQIVAGSRARYAMHRSMSSLGSLISAGFQVLHSNQPFTPPQELYPFEKEVFKKYSWLENTKALFSAGISPK